MPVGHCYYCLRAVERKELKKCSRCAFVKYCSRECQVASWKATHKNTCEPRKLITEPATNACDLYNQEEERALSRWLAAWTSVLTTATTIALDLANHPQRNKTHCLLLLLRRRHSPVDAKRFTILEATIEPCSELLKEFPALESVLTDPPTLPDERARFVVTVENPEDPDSIERVRCRVWCQRSFSAYRDAPNKETMKDLAEGVKHLLIYEIERGDPVNTQGQWKHTVGN